MKTPETPSTDRGLEQSAAFSTVLVFLLVAVVFAFAWVLAGLVSLGILTYSVPLLASDLKQASWLGSPSSALHLTSGYLGVAFLFVFSSLGVGIAVAKKNACPALVAVLIGLCLFVGGSEESAVRIGVLDGTVRIGCYVPESLECKRMLGLPAENALSMFKNADNSSEWASWYAEKRAVLQSEKLSFRSLFYITPSGALLRAPLYLGSADELRELLEKQRQEVADLKKH